MLTQIRRSLTALGGFQVLASVFAIGWGLSTLQKVVDERQARLDQLSQELEQAEFDLAVIRHPANGAPKVAYPSAEDLASLQSALDTAADTAQ